MWAQQTNACYMGTMKMPFCCIFGFQGKVDHFCSTDLGWDAFHAKFGFGLLIFEIFVFIVHFILSYTSQYLEILPKLVHVLFNYFKFGGWIESITLHIQSSICIGWGKNWFARNTQLLELLV